jgi:mannose-6-phosphate isomerase-like protein (cupin superfamily)
MKGYIGDIEKATKENTNFRSVLYTAKSSQLVVMSLNPQEDIGEEIHELDQFLRMEEGEGKAFLDGVEYAVKDDWAIVVPAGMKHNVLNTGTVPLKLYTIYSPPEHKDGTVHKTKTDAEADTEDHFDGKTTE